MNDMRITSSGEKILREFSDKIVKALTEGGHFSGGKDKESGKIYLTTATESDGSINFDKDSLYKTGMTVQIKVNTPADSSKSDRDDNVRILLDEVKLNQTDTADSQNISQGTVSNIVSKPALEEDVTPASVPYEPDRTEGKRPGPDAWNSGGKDDDGNFLQLQNEGNSDEEDRDDDLSDNEDDDEGDEDWNDGDDNDDSDGDDGDSQ